MTTPSVDLNIVMPYGVTVQGDGSNYPAIVGEHSKKATNSSISLPAGPCRVAASWEGPDSISLQVVSGGKMRKLAQLPEKAGGGVRTVMVTVGALEGDRIVLFGSRLTPGATGTLEVYPINFE